jgi:multidrug efflux pump subunit AcrA (membrane-fusion protein)
MSLKKSKKRAAWIVIAIVLVAGAGAAIYASTKAKKDPKGASEETTKVEKRSVDDIIEVSGHLKPLLAQEIRAPVDGIVAEVLAKAGDKLAPGDLIARMNSSAAVYAVDSARYQIEQESFSGNRRKVELLKRELEAKEKAVEDLNLRAHIGGTVSKLDLKAGDVVVAGTSYGRIIDVSALVADVEIAESDIPRARPGQAVEFRFPALPGLIAKGRVDAFPAEARINERGLAVLDAKLVIDSPPKGLLPAYSFSAVIKAGEARDVLVADSRAVSYKMGKPFVERKKADGSYESLSVETEGFGSGLVRIVTGCAEGDTLKIPSPKAK